jgi:hypothetical protein
MRFVGADIRAQSGPAKSGANLDARPIPRFPQRPGHRVGTWPSTTRAAGNAGVHTSTIFPLTSREQRTRPVSSSVASVRHFSRVQAALGREAAAGWLAGWLAGRPAPLAPLAPLASLRRERKPLDLMLWLPFRGLSAHRDSRLAPCKTPHPVQFGPVLPCPWTMQ